MNEKDKTFQQQILFDDDVLNNSSDKKGIVKDAIVFDEEDFSVERDIDEDINKPLHHTGKPRWILRLFISTLCVLMGIELIEFFTLGFSESPIVTSLYAVLTLCIALLLGKTLIQEFISVRSYKKQMAVQKQVHLMAEGQIDNSAKALCDKISEKLPGDIQVSLQTQWNELATDTLSSQEIMQLYSRTVLTKVDEKALAEVTKYSSESVVIIALSPLALLDMMLMLWRNLRMLDKIANLYGLKLSYLSRISLIKQAFKNMLYAGASELVLDFGTDALGAELVGKLSARMAQGVGAGMLTARLGLKAIQLCRPIPMEKPPQIKTLRKHIIQQIKQLINTSSK